MRYDRLERNAERADEVRPTTNGALLGRVLAVLGAPVGQKTDQQLALPAYLEGAPERVRERFVAVYLEHRAVCYESKATLTIREARNRAYLESLAALIDSVADGDVTLGEQYITITAGAARTLETEPRRVSELGGASRQNSGDS